MTTPQAELEAIFDSIAPADVQPWHRAFATQFSRWIQFDLVQADEFRPRHPEIVSMPYRDLLGVYLVAHTGPAPFEPHPSGEPANWLDDRILYVGYGASLGRRWKRLAATFHERRRTGKAGRSTAGWKLADVSAVTSISHLSVAALAVRVPGRKKNQADGALSPALAKLLQRYMIARILAHRRASHSTAVLLNED